MAVTKVLTKATPFEKNSKVEADWTKSQLEALCPTSQWDTTFASQVDSVITNPPNKPVPDTDYSIPS